MSNHLLDFHSIRYRDLRIKLATRPCTPVLCRRDIDGQVKEMADFSGKVTLVVNVASE